eukprot:4841845-Prorocentrum_lima.AAC.1
MSDYTSGTYDVVIPEPTVSQLAGHNELNNPLPRMNTGAPGLRANDQVPQHSSAAASSSYLVGSSSMMI